MSEATARVTPQPLTQEVLAPMPNQYTMPNPAERFFTKVRFTKSCWLWQAATLRHGYGVFTLQGRSILAHVYAYELCVGPVPEGLELDHTCRIRNCVYPWHVEPVTRRVNQHRGMSFSGVNSRKTHCENGHRFDEANTYI
ncbi:hypothetical protein LCGC14_2834040, partial [marine sediment metagenome]